MTLRQNRAISRLTLALACATGLTPAVMAKAPTAVPPRLEPVVIASLPLPPTAPSDEPGTCTLAINPHSTGCMTAMIDGIIEGPAYMWDAKHVLLAVEFTGAPAAPNPASIYNGPQVIAIKTDGGLFSNGDPWKCITCGIPPEAREDADPSSTDGGGRPHAAGWIKVDHPQAFPGDRKMITGTNVIDCGPLKLVDDACTPGRLRVYPIRWDASAGGSVPTGAMRELRLNPDGLHLMWDHSNKSPVNPQVQALVGTLVFNPSPKAGMPLGPRYDLVDTVVMGATGNPEFAPFRQDPADPTRLIHNRWKGAIGEPRGWTRDGKKALGMGIVESGNMDMFATDLQTAQSHRLTSAPGYADPIMMSPDDKWFVVLDNRTVDRHMYYGAMQGIPPLVDLVTGRIQVSPRYGYRNGLRRFFQPILVDSEGDRGDYVGQQLNSGPGSPGSPSDPNWNARADPAWSPDGTNVVYWQAQVTAPDCGGVNPLPCPASTEPGGRRTRLMIAHLTGRKPLALASKAAPERLTVPWGTPYTTGDPMVRRDSPAPVGKFTMQGWVGGSAQVEIRKDMAGSITFVSASYTRFTDDGVHIIDGTESAERVSKESKPRIVWHSDLRSSGRQIGTKKTSEPGGFVFSLVGEPLEGELVTTINGKTYRPPRPGT